MIFYIEVDDGQRPWDLSVVFQGARYTVRKPNGQDISRVHDLAGASNEAAYLVMVEFFSSLTGIDQARCRESIDIEILDAFFTALRDYSDEIWDLKRTARQKMAIVNDRLLPAVCLARGSG